MDNIILVLTNSIKGLFYFRKEVVMALKNQGYKIYISAPEEHDELYAYFEKIGCTIVKVHFNSRGTNPLSDMKLVLAYLRLIRSVKPKVVLTYTIKPNVYGGMACRLLGIIQFANITGLGDAIENGGWMKRLTLFLYKIGTRKACRLFFQNKSNLDFFVNKGFDSSKAVLLPGSGVNLKWHTYQPYPQDGILKFLYVGRLLKDKGIDEYIKMSKAIKKAYPDTIFGIAGSIEGKYKEQIEEMVSCNIIVFYGQVSDVRPLYGEFHCIVMPSYHEGMSNVNLESAANGRPVITTNVPGCKETVDDKVSGFLVAPKNADDLTEKVRQFIMLPYKAKVQMGRCARQKVEHEFDRNIVVRKYLDAINQLTNN